MKRILTDIDPVKVGLLKSVLDEAGIECFVKNLNASIGIGEIPFVEIWPELWVTHEKDEEKAREAIANMEMDKVDLSDQIEPWFCKGCGIEVEGGLGECWKCGEDKPEDQSPL